MASALQVKDVLWQLRHGHRESAAAGIAALIESNSDVADQWLHVAHGALSIGELTLAETAARKFLYINRAQVERAVQCAGVLAEAGRFDKALRLIRPYLKNSPQDPALNHLCGTIYQQLGEQKLAAKHLRATLKGAQLAGISWLTLAAQHRFSEQDPLLEQLLGLEKAFARSDPFNRVQYYFALGKALLDTGQFDRSFDAFSTGAALAPDAAQYSAVHDMQRADATIAQNDLRHLAAVRSPEADQGRAIFVVGLPRTGTTLLQRILTAHKAISDGGEFSGMGVATMDLRRRALANSEALGRQEDAGVNELGAIAGVYRHLADERFGRKGLIVDKSINNTHYAGLIAKAFPDAAIIIIERDMLDVAWSCFRTCFSKGMQWSWSLTDIAAHFMAEIKLIDHWKEVLADRVLTVRYEDLVREPERVLPGILEMSGLEFNANMLNFYQRKSAVTTASVVQVNQALNSKAIGSAQAVSHRMQAFLDAYQS